MFDFKEFAAERYSVRRFSPQVVEQEKIEYLLEAARLAPTAHNDQPQRILVIKDAQALAKLKSCTAYTFNAPLAILVCYDETAAWVRDYDNKHSGEVDASIIGTHLTLAASSIGLGSTWVMSFDPVAIRNAYNIPDNIIPTALFPIGYPADNSRPSKLHNDRLQIGETTFYDQFD